MNKLDNKETASRTVSWSIKWKLMTFIAALVLCLVAILSYAQISSQKRILEGELENRIELMKANLIERGKSYITSLSQQVENDLAVMNFSGVMEEIHESTGSNEEIKYAILMMSSGEVFSHTKRPDLTQTKLTGDHDVWALRQTTMAVTSYKDSDEQIIEIVNPLQISTEPWGVLRIIFSQKVLKDEIKRSRQQIQDEIKRMIGRSLLTSLGFLGACLFIVFFLSSRVSKPLIHLTEAARKLSKGDFSVSSDILIRSRDEVGVLGNSFFKMSKDLKNSYTKLEEYSNRYRAIFEYSPISLWEEDFSEVKIFLDRLRETGIQDFRMYFADHPAELRECTNMITLLDINESTLALYAADTKEAVLQGIDRILAGKSHEIFEEQVLVMAEGKPFEIQCTNKTLTDKEISVSMKASIPPGYEETWSKVLVSVHDLSERMRAEFLKDMFGRYLSEEVTNTLLENPDMVKLGGEKRTVTIMMSDLRGFTALADRLEPEQVVQILNAYFEVMVDVLLKYNATINEIIGDALLVIFGAPQAMPDRAERAIACAIEMQNAMTRVNEQNRSQGLSEIEMGIGLNDVEVIVGNIGSSKRSKYGVVGSGVNMTSRIESYSVGGQILISDSVIKATENILRIDAQREVTPKGSESPIRIYAVGGISGSHNLVLEKKDTALKELIQDVPLKYSVVGGKNVDNVQQSCRMHCLSRKSVEATFEEELDLLTNIKMNLVDVPEELALKDIYGKVMEAVNDESFRYLVRFTSTPPEVNSYFQALLQFAGR